MKMAEWWITAIHSFPIGQKWWIAGSNLSFSDLYKKNSGHKILWSAFFSYFKLSRFIPK